MHLACSLLELLQPHSYHLLFHHWKLTVAQAALWLFGSLVTPDPTSWALALPPTPSCNTGIRRPEAPRLPAASRALLAGAPPPPPPPPPPLPPAPRLRAPPRGRVMRSFRRFASHPVRSGARPRHPGVGRGARLHAAPTFYSPAPKDKARWKRLRRDEANKASAQAIIRSAGGGAAAAAAIPATPQTAAAPPRFPAFRAAGTLPELCALMQQAAAELPYYE
jgi:hypothetical protein